MSRRTTGLPRCQIFESERHARDWLEGRAWKQGVVCPHCGGNADQDRITRLGGRAHRRGLYQCNHARCRRQFTVTVATVFEGGKIPLHKALAALFLISEPYQRVPVAAVHRTLGISYKSTWHMVRRLREAVNEADQDQHLDESTRPLSGNRRRVADHAPKQSTERSRLERREPRDPSRNRAYLQSQAARISATLELLERVRRSKENEERLLSDGNRPDESADGAI